MNAFTKMMNSDYQIQHAIWRHIGHQNRRAGSYHFLLCQRAGSSYRINTTFLFFFYHTCKREEKEHSDETTNSPSQEGCSAECGDAAQTSRQAWNTEHYGAKDRPHGKGRTQAYKRVTKIEIQYEFGRRMSHHAWHTADCGEKERTPVKLHAAEGWARKICNVSWVISDSSPLDFKGSHSLCEERDEKRGIIVNLYEI